MTYSETLDYLFSRLPMYQRQGSSAYRADLTTTIACCNRLDNPERKFQSIHVGGTNGKGSVSHLIAAALQSEGYKVGLLTSPHLKDFRERIRINGEMIPEEAVVDFVASNMINFHDLTPSFFEYSVVMGFNYFAQQEVDIAVIEVGMGGRLDSSNVIQPLVSVITNIGWDHMKFLGSSLEQIAGEKAGIIKENTPVVIGKTQPETKNVFVQAAKKQNATITFADQKEAIQISSDLLGNYQRENINTAFYALNQLQISTGFSLKENSIISGFGHVQELTGLRGRWQVLQKEPFIVADTAHNKEGLTSTMTQFSDLSFSKQHIVFGCVNDKELDHLIPLMPKDAVYYLCTPNVPRGLNVEELANLFDAQKMQYNTFSSVQEAFTEARSKLKIGEGLYIGGSTFVVAEVIP